MQREKTLLLFLVNIELNNVLLWYIKGFEDCVGIFMITAKFLQLSERRIRLKSTSWVQLDQDILCATLSN